MSDPCSQPVHAAGRYFRNSLVEILKNDFGFEKVYSMLRNPSLEWTAPTSPCSGEPTRQADLRTHDPPSQPCACDNAVTRVRERGGEEGKNANSWFICVVLEFNNGSISLYSLICWNTYSISTDPQNWNHKVTSWLTCELRMSSKDLSKPPWFSYSVMWTEKEELQIYYCYGLKEGRYSPKVSLSPIIVSQLPVSLTFKLGSDLIPW